jgi:hypothetical protein
LTYSKSQYNKIIQCAVEVVSLQSRVKEKIIQRGCPDSTNNKRTSRNDHDQGLRAPTCTVATTYYFTAGGLCFIHCYLHVIDKHNHYISRDQQVLLNLIKGYNNNTYRWYKWLPLFICLYMCCIFISPFLYARKMYTKLMVHLS